MNYPGNTFDLQQQLSSLQSQLQNVGNNTPYLNPNMIQPYANTDPRLKKMNLDDLYGSAQKLAQEQGMDLEDVQKQIDSTFAPHLK